MRSDLARIALGWGAVAILFFSTPEPSLAAPYLSLAAIIGVIIICAFGVVKQAEALGRRLGDPYGSLVLTLSIVLIEVILICAVMLGPGDHTTIARDSVMAVSMIIMNLVIGLALLVGGVKHRSMAHNRTGTSAYLAMIVVLSSLAFALPALIGRDGSYTAGQAIPITIMTIAVYMFFLWRQMGPQADDFREKTHRRADPRQVMQVLRAHRAEIATRVILLMVTVTPIVLLSHDMAALLDEGLKRAGAPVALAGVLIAMIVFLPESLTAIRAALAGEVQRVSNLCHGALVSTVGLTIPAVLIIGMLTGQTVVLAESPANLLMLGVTLALSIAAFSAERVTAVHGAAHLVVFASYGIILFS